MHKRLSSAHGVAAALVADHAGNCATVVTAHQRAAQLLALYLSPTHELTRAALLAGCLPAQAASASRFHSAQQPMPLASTKPLGSWSGQRGGQIKRAWVNRRRWSPTGIDASKCMAVVAIRRRAEHLLPLFLSPDGELVSYPYLCADRRKDGSDATRCTICCAPVPFFCKIS